MKLAALFQLLVMELIGEGLQIGLLYLRCEMANITYANLKPDYAELWHNMEIKSEKQEAISKVADKIVSLKDKYEVIQQLTTVPWYMVGLIHLRESNNNFNTHLHNGDLLTARTIHAPRGYPRTGNPPFTFEYSAVDALKKEGLDKVTDWGIERIAYFFEKFNGFGYRGKGVNSPYLWAGTNNYTKGKYIRDGVYSANVVDSQLGVMPILKVILEKTENVMRPTVEPTISPTATVDRPTTKELRKKSKKFSLLEWWQWVTGIGAGGAATVQTLNASNISATKTYVDTIKSFFGDYGVFIAILVLITAFISINYLMKRQKDDVQGGRYTPSGEVEGQ